MVKGHDDVEEEDAQNSSSSKWACSSISSSSGGAKPSCIKQISILGWSRYLNTAFNTAVYKIK